MPELIYRLIRETLAIAVVILSSQICLGSGPEEVHVAPRDYATFSHVIQISELRGGNHSSDSSNNYKLLFSVVGFKKAVFGSIQIEGSTSDAVLLSDIGSVELPPVKPLEYIRFVGKNKLAFMKLISGDTLRATVSKAMKKFETSEDQIDIAVLVKLVKIGKVAFFFGQDETVGETKYFPLSIEPDKPSHKPKGSFTISDAKGAYSLFEVEYKAEGKGERKS